jgi:hypothetical protein
MYIHINDIKDLSKRDISAIEDITKKNTKTGKSKIQLLKEAGIST